MEEHEQIVVGVNAFVSDETSTERHLTVDDNVEERQRERVQILRARRDDERANALRHRLALAAQGTENLMPLIIECVENDVTLGEICQTLRDVWGQYHPADF